MKKRLIDIVGKVEYPITCAIIKNQLTGFLDEVETDVKTIEFLDVRFGEGRRTYERTLAFLSAYVARNLNPNWHLSIKHSYGDTLYGEIEGEDPAKYADVLLREMKKVVAEDAKIEKLELPKEDVIEKLREEGRVDDIKLLKFLSRYHIPIYTLKNFFAYFAGPLLPRTGLLKVFDIVPYPPGFLIVLPDRENPEKLATIPHREKLFHTFQESKEWVKILGVNYVGDLNELIANGKISEMLKIQEAFHDKKIAQIADMIYKRRESVRVVLIAGPSSSGKTTFAKRLRIHLRVVGLNPVTLSTDNYFVDREKTPLDENGEPDYESFEAIDHELLRKHLAMLIRGEEVQIPKFNFHTGHRSNKTIPLKLEKDDIVIIEGIHALNPRLTEGISDENKFRIYVSALTQLNIDAINRIPTRDTRLIRRLVRDMKYRGHDAKTTIQMWPKVQRGEERWIFPYQEEADVMFNSALVHELAVLKIYAEPILRVLDSSEREYAEALRLLNFLSHFMGLLPDEIPPTSIVREFIGGSSFKY